MITELHEYATRWLNPLTQRERDIVDKVVLEQVCYAVPPAVRNCLMKVGPTTLDQAAACLENFVLAEKVGSRPEWATPEKSLPKPKPNGPNLSLVRHHTPSNNMPLLPSYKSGVTRILSMSPFFGQSKPTRKAQKKASQPHLVCQEYQVLVFHVDERGISEENVR